MADKRTFTIVIDGVRQSYENVVKLYDALQKIKHESGKVTGEVKKFATATSQASKEIKEKTAVLSGELIAEVKMEQILEKRKLLDTEIGRELINVNQAFRERVKKLEETIRMENLAAGSMNEIKLRLDTLRESYRNLGNEERNTIETGGVLLTQIGELSKLYKELSDNLANIDMEPVNKLEETLTGLSNNIGKAADSAGIFVNSFQAVLKTYTLFDRENEQVQQTLQSLSKIMTTVKTLQELNNTILKKGAAVSMLMAAADRVRALQAKAAAVATELSTKNTIAATAAQKIFNTVAYANPYVLLAMAIVSVAGALVLFCSGTETAADKQKKLNDLVNDSIDNKEKYVSAAKAMNDANIKEMERELALLKAKGASETQIAQKERHIFEQRLKNAKANAKLYEKEINDIDKNYKKVKELTLEIEKYQNGLKDGIYQNNDAYKKQMETLQSNLSIYQKYLNLGLQAQNDLRNAQNNLDIFEANTAKKALDAGKKALDAGKRDAQAMADYRVLLAQKGSKAELDAQIEAANVRLRNDLSNVDLTNGERLRRTQENLLEIEKLETDYRKKQQQEEIDLINARIVTVEKGTYQEFSLRSELLLKQLNRDLDNEELSIERKTELQKKYYKDLDDLGKNFQKTVTQISVNTAISNINARLASVKEGSRQELDLLIDAAKESARLAEDSASASIDNQKEKAAKILEINRKLEKNIRDLNYDYELNEIGNSNREQTLMLTQELEARKIKKSDYEGQMLQITIESLQNEINLRKKYGKDTVDLEIQLSEKRIGQAEFEKNKRSEFYEELNAKLQNYADNISQCITAIFDATNTILQLQLDEANEKYEAISQKYDEVVEKREDSNTRLQDLEEQAKNARGGRLLVLQQQINAEMEANKRLAEQEKQLAQEKEKQEKEIAGKEKQMKKAELTRNIIEGISNTALGVTKALKWGIPLGPVYAAIIGAMGALQVGVMSAQLAKLEDGGLLRGKRHASGGMRVQGTNIEVEGGEYVVNRESTSKNMELIRFINSQRRQLGEKDINAFFTKTSVGFDPPFKRVLESGGRIPVFENKINIDNESLVEAIRSIKIEPVVSVKDITNVQQDMVKVDNWIGL